MPKNKHGFNNLINALYYEIFNSKYSYSLLQKSVPDFGISEKKLLIIATFSFKQYL